MELLEELDVLVVVFVSLVTSKKLCLISFQRVLSDKPHYAVLNTIAP